MATALRLPSISTAGSTNGKRAQKAKNGKRRPPVPHGQQVPVDGARELIAAVKSHDLDTLRELLRAGVNANSVDDESGATAAQLAMHSKDSRKAEVLVLLLQYGAYISGGKSAANSPTGEVTKTKNGALVLPRIDQQAPKLKSPKKRRRERVKGLKHAYAKFGMGPNWETKHQEERRMERRRIERQRARLQAEARRRQKELEDLERQQEELARKKAERKAERKRLKREEAERKKREELERLAREEEERQRLIAEEAARKAAEAERRRQEAAALTIQCACRCSLARKRVDAIREAKRRELAALTIQCASRCFLARKRVAALHEGKLREAAALTIQCARRCQLARRKVAQLRQRIAAAIVIQCAWRSYVARKEVAQRRRALAAAITIQCAWRSYIARKRAAVLRKAKMDADAAARAEQEENARNAAALTIQCAWRSYLARKRVAALRKVKDDAETAANAAREAAATKIQCAWRRFLAQKRVADLRAAAEVAAREAAAIKLQCMIRRRQSMVKVDDLRQKRAAELMKQAKQNAAVKISAATRGWLTRKKLSKEAAAATRVQAMFRAWKARQRYKELWSHKQALEEKALQEQKKEDLLVDTAHDSEVREVVTHDRPLQRSATKKRGLKRTQTQAALAAMEESSEDESSSDEEDLMDIFTAVANNDVKNLREIVVREGQDIDERHSRTGQTPLMLAATKGFTEVLDVLLEHKANRGAATKDGTTAVILACLKGHTPCLTAILDPARHEQGPCSKETLDAQLEEDGCSALHISAENAACDCVAALLNAKADPDVVDLDGCTTLIVTVSADPEEMDEEEVADTFDIIEMLLEAGADTNIPDNNSATPLAAAIQLGTNNVVEALLEHKADPYALDHNGEFPLQQIVSEKRGTPEMLRMCMKHISMEGMKEHKLMGDDGEGDTATVQGKQADQIIRSPLDCPLFKEKQRLIMLAVLNRRIDLAKTLVELGCAYWLRDGTGSGLLDFTRAVYQKDPAELELPDDKALSIACEENAADDINRLVGFGTRPHFLDGNGMSPLMYACYTGSDRAVAALLQHVPEDEREAVSNCQAEGTGMFALILATYGMSGMQSTNQLETVCALFQNAPGLAINEQLGNGSTALFMAAQENIGDVVVELLKRKADANICTSKGVAPLYIAAHDGSEEIVKALLGAEDIVVDPVNARGATPLYIAVQKSFDPIIAALLEAKANPNVVTEAGSTPLALAVHHCDFEVVKLLLDAKAIVDDTKHSNGNTEVTMAALSGHVDILKLLIEAGASLDTENDDGQTVHTILSNVHGLNVDEVMTMATENERLAAMSPEELHTLLHESLDGDRSLSARAHIVFSLPASHPEFQSHIKDLFDDCDSDGNGNISRNELVDFFARHAPELAKRYGENYKLFIDEEFKRLDHDHDETVSFKEFKACFGRLHQLIRRELNDVQEERRAGGIQRQRTVVRSKD